MPATRARVILLVLVLFLSACSARTRGEIQGSPADPANLPDIVGTYAVNGFDPLGNEYGGTLRIRSAPDDTYTMEWLVTGALLSGQGHIEGNQLIYIWQSIDDRQRPVAGEGSYTITDLGELFGERYVEGVETPGTENLFPNE